MKLISEDMAHYNRLEEDDKERNYAYFSSQSTGVSSAPGARKCALLYPRDSLVWAPGNRPHQSKTGNPRVRVRVKIKRGKELVRLRPVK